MASQETTACKYAKFQKSIDFVNDSFKCMLVQPGFIFLNYPTHQHYSDVSGSEVANSNGYATGGVACSGALSADGVNQLAQITWNTISIGVTANSISACGAFIYHVASGTLIEYLDFGGAQTVQSGGAFVMAGVVVGEQ